LVLVIIMSLFLPVNTVRSCIFLSGVVSCKKRIQEENLCI